MKWTNLCRREFRRRNTIITFPAHWCRICTVRRGHCFYASRWLVQKPINYTQISNEMTTQQMESECLRVRIKEWRKRSENELLDVTRARKFPLSNSVPLLMVELSAAGRRRLTKEMREMYECLSNGIRIQSMVDQPFGRLKLWICSGAKIQFWHSQQWIALELHWICNNRMFASTHNFRYYQRVSSSVI